ncbi:MAG: cobalt-precorrin-6A reductase [Rhodospirillaceae bacterium]|jgi:precorrin-6A/cobalt-precorrin-6A reductase|nr:cobalt-precorrin-6A reductase [Rhodospirillaceae bacterium]MBT6094558.1 cobalt-precorrin-6A reductase [Rhodospirillaceae bacterium]
MRRLLILGGTAEARALAEAAVNELGDRLEVVTSWAGRTDRAPDVAGDTRVGGFGGAAGLTDYLRTEAIDFVIDATHPFAETISEHAHDACVTASVARLQLFRLAWALPPSGRWLEVDDMAAAARTIGDLGSRIFLTTGKQTVNAFSDVENVWFLVRLIDPPAEPLPLANCEVATGRPPYDLEAERALMERHRIDALVSKSSGGALPEKIIAAFELGLPVLLVAPPPPPPGMRVSHVDEAMAWVRTQI